MQLLTQRKTLLIGFLILAGQAAISLLLIREEYLPSPPPLSAFSDRIGSWQTTTNVDIDIESYQALSPDDVLNRVYTREDKVSSASMFIGYYKTQHRAKNAHDPKVCLPGGGWTPEVNTERSIRLPSGGLASVNYYVISKGGVRNVVIYWFQTHKGPKVGEQGLRLQRVMDTWRENRTDMALVRIVVPVAGAQLEKATGFAVELAESSYPEILKQFPASPSKS